MHGTRYLGWAHGIFGISGDGPVVTGSSEMHGVQLAETELPCCQAPGEGGPRGGGFPGYSYWPWSRGTTSGVLLGSVSGMEGCRLRCS